MARTEALQTIKKMRITARFLAHLKYCPECRSVIRYLCWESEIRLYYVSTAVTEQEIDLSVVNAELVSLEKRIEDATEKHNAFLKGLGLPLLPYGASSQ